MGNQCCSANTKQSTDFGGLIDDIFTRRSSDLIDQRTNKAVERLSSYLTEHPADFRKCVKMLETKSQATIKISRWTKKDVSRMKLLLLTVQVLVVDYPQHFTSLTYEIARKVLSFGHFEQIKNSLLPLLFKTSDSELEQVFLVSDQFLKDFISHCLAKPTQVERAEIALLTQLIRKSQDASLEDQANKRWESVLDFTLMRLKTDLPKHEKPDLIEAEKQLFATLCDLMLKSEHNAHELTLRVLNSTVEQEALSEFLQTALGIVCKSASGEKARFIGEVLKTNVDFLRELTTNENKEIQIQALCEFLTQYMKEATDPVQTLTYSSSGISLLEAWSLKTDLQSCIRFLLELVETQKTAEADVCFTSIKQGVFTRIQKDWGLDLFGEAWNQLISMWMQRAGNYQQSNLIFRVIRWGIKTLGDKLKVRMYDAKTVDKAGIARLRDIAGTFTEETFKLCKYCSQIWLHITSRALPQLLPSLLKVAVNLQVISIQKLISSSEDPSLQACLSVLLLAHLHSLGTFYRLPNLLDFVINSSSEIQRLGIYEELFIDKDWAKVYDHSFILFKTSDFPLFSKCESPSFIEAIPAQFRAHERKSLDDSQSFIKESMDPLEPVDSENSSPVRKSDFSDVFSIDIGEIVPQICDEEGTEVNEEEEENEQPMKEGVESELKGNRL